MRKSKRGILQGKEVDDDFSDAYFMCMLIEVGLDYDPEFKNFLIKQIEEWIEDVMSEDNYGAAYFASFFTVQGIDERSYVVTLTNVFKDHTCYCKFNRPLK